MLIPRSCTAAKSVVQRTQYPTSSWYKEGPAVKKVLVFVGLAFALAAALEVGPEVAMTIESPVVACSR
jgi:hypothetical protein